MAWHPANRSIKVDKTTDWQGIDLRIPRCSGSRGNRQDISPSGGHPIRLRRRSSNKDRCPIFDQHFAHYCVVLPTTGLEFYLDDARRQVFSTLRRPVLHRPTVFGKPLRSSRSGNEANTDNKAATTCKRVSLFITPLSRSAHRARRLEQNSVQRHPCKLTRDDWRALASRCQHVPVVPSTLTLSLQVFRASGMPLQWKPYHLTTKREE